jgi:hypothetical protein
LKAIKNGTPDAQLEDTLVLAYLLERYQAEAAAKEIGGLDYRYALRGDGQAVTAIVAPEDQRKALAAVLETLSSANLTLPESLLRLLPPRPPGLEHTQESFPSKTGLTFDPIATAEASADLTLELLLQPERAARLVEYHARDSRNPGLEEMLDAIVKATWQAPQTTGLELTVQHAVQMRSVEALLALAANPAASAETKAILRTRLARLKAELANGGPMAVSAIARIEEFERDPAKFTPATPVEAPPGMPIGDGDGGPWSF